MADPLSPGPLRYLNSEGLSPTPLYVIPFDKNGVCAAPRTLDDLVQAAAESTDVYLFSHGWNNDWPSAMDLYGRFIEQFATAQRDHWRPPARPYRPLLVGVFWPSIVLAGQAGEAPEMAGGTVGAGLDEVGLFAEALPARQAQRLYELSQYVALDQPQAAELAKLLAPLLAGDDDELAAGEVRPTSDDLLAIWKQQVEPTNDPGGYIGDEPAPSGEEEPIPAGWPAFLDPRTLIRGATVLVMKDRAGKVGGSGVAAMLTRLLGAPSEPRVHLVGHSYGAKVVLSALCLKATGRNVDSVLLLQPAMSCLCFAADVDGRGHPGGYRGALQLTETPVVVTFSRHDFPLTRVFHLAVRRASDLGEAVIAGGPPSRYAALGGYGPQGLATGEVATVEPQWPPTRYTSGSGIRIIAVRADDVIGGHSDVANPATAWMLLSQVMR